MASIQVLFLSVWTLIFQQQQQEIRGLEQWAELVPLPPLVVTKPPMDPTPTVAIHKIFMSTKPPNIPDKEGPDRVEEWLRKIEKAASIVEVQSVCGSNLGLIC